MRHAMLILDEPIRHGFLRSRHGAETSHAACFSSHLPSLPLFIIHQKTKTKYGRPSTSTHRCTPYGRHDRSPKSALHLRLAHHHDFGVVVCSPCYDCSTQMMRREVRDRFTGDTISGVTMNAGTSRGRTLINHYLTHSVNS